MDLNLFNLIIFGAFETHQNHPDCFQDKIGWKYSKKRLKQYLYVAKVIRTKKVICVCGATIKLSRKWDEDYINRHARSKGCKWDEGQKTLYHYFNTPRKHKNDDSDEEWKD
ncbi:hypothetical protein RhiirC2_720043 [Rhizophagus irregularis]|uniref:Uncharacterized protein n=1 Tax=Rhizophagus irregularis TaxID=588596 RepID=A0A2N1MBU2_9GLOM|nr:hypothetical protein RhiirC2_720043 [Rhizophagus irregularis]